MKTGKVIQPTQITPKQKLLILDAEEKKRLVEFFSLLIEIDQRNKKKKL